MHGHYLDMSSATFGRVARGSPEGTRGAIPRAPGSPGAWSAVLGIACLLAATGARRRRAALALSAGAIAAALTGCAAEGLESVRAVDGATTALDDAGAARRPPAADAGAPIGEDAGPVAVPDSGPAPGGRDDAGADAGSSTLPRCEVIFERRGLVHESVASELKRQIRIPMPGPSSWDSIEVELDVHLAGWTRAQGQHEVFTLLRADRWVGNAIGYVAFAGADERYSLLVSNLELPFAADRDGRRITRTYAFEPGMDYHVRYLYDAAAEWRSLQVSVGGAVVHTLAGTSTARMTRVPTVEVPGRFVLLLGGTEALEGPDASTLGWRFENVRVSGCRHVPS